MDARPEILPFLDQEIVQRLKAAMLRLGVQLIQGQRWKGAQRGERRCGTTLADGSVVHSQQLLFAAGRA